MEIFTPRYISLSISCSQYPQKVHLLMMYSPGFNLLSLAVEESSTITEDPSFARQLYIHGLTYLLRGLPADLTTEEQLSVRSSLPQGVVGSLPIDLKSDNSKVQPNNNTSRQNEPSLLHRILASVIVQLFII